MKLTKNDLETLTLMFPNKPSSYFLKLSESFNTLETLIEYFLLSTDKFSNTNNKEITGISDDMNIEMFRGSDVNITDRKNKNKDSGSHFYKENNLRTPVRNNTSFQKEPECLYSDNLKDSYDFKPTFDDFETSKIRIEKNYNKKKIQNEENSKESDENTITFHELLYNTKTLSLIRRENLIKITDPHIYNYPNFFPLLKSNYEFASKYSKFKIQDGVKNKPEITSKNYEVFRFNKDKNINYNFIDMREYAFRCYEMYVKYKKIEDEGSNMVFNAYKHKNKDKHGNKDHENHFHDITGFHGNEKNDYKYKSDYKNTSNMNLKNKNGKFDANSKTVTIHNNAKNSEILPTLPSSQSYYKIYKEYMKRSSEMLISQILLNRKILYGNKNSNINGGSGIETHVLDFHYLFVDEAIKLLEDYIYLYRHIFYKKSHLYSTPNVNSKIDQNMSVKGMKIKIITGKSGRLLPEIRRYCECNDILWTCDDVTITIYHINDK